MTDTPNHNLNRPEKGANDWHVPLNENFGDLDTILKGMSSDGTSLSVDEQSIIGNYIYAYGANGNYVEAINPADYANGGEAIQAAVDSLPAYDGTLTEPGRGEVYIPRGSYEIHSPIQLTGRMKIRGAGTKTTVLHVADGANTNVFEWEPPSENIAHFCHLSEFLIAGNRSNNTSGKGIVMSDVNGSRGSELIMKDVYIRDMADHGIVLSGSWSVRIERCTPEANGGSGKTRHNIHINTNNNENLHVSNNFLAYGEAYAAYVGGVEATFRNNWFYQAGDIGVHVSGDRNHFVGNRIYANSQNSAGSQPGAYIDGSYNTFVGNYWDGSKSGTNYEKHAIQFTSNAVENVIKPAYINWNSYTGAPIVDNGQRNVVGDRVTSPEQITLSSSAESIFPVQLPVSNIPVHVTPGASGRTIYGVRDIDKENQQVTVVNVGSNSVTLDHNAAVASPFVNQSGAADTLGTDQMAGYQYDTHSGAWRQIMPPV